MKSNRFNRVISATLAIVMTFMLISPTLAAGKYPGNDDKKDAQKKLPNVKAAIIASVQNQDNRKAFSPEELEQMRSSLLELLDANQELTALLSPQSIDKIKNSILGEQKKDDNFADARRQIQKMSDKDLTTLRRSLNPSRMQEKLGNSRAVFNEYKNDMLRASSIIPDSPGLPGIDSFCGDPVPTSVIIAADVVYFLAEAVRDIAQDGCNEVLVVLGEGGNGRLVCLITDAIYIIAKAVNQGIHFCDDDYAASVGQASYDRLGHIHGDLETSVANDNTNTTNILNDAATNTTTIVNNDNTNKDTIIANDNTNKNTIIANDNANTLALTNLINNALTTIINNANANKDELKNLILRTQIEADLASTDGSVFVALYETASTTCTASFATPVTQCGYLDLVRIIVSETIANQGNDKNALKDLANGDTQRTAGQYKAAYTSYRKAYKSAAK